MIEPVVGMQDSLRYTLNHYRTPLVIVAVGVVLSIAGFTWALSFQTGELHRNFLRSSTQEASLIDDKLLLFQEKIHGVSAFFVSSERVNADMMGHYVRPMMERIPFEMVGWIPESYYGGSNFSISDADLPIPPDLREIENLPPLVNSFAIARQTRQFAISQTFAFNNDDQIRHIALIAPVIKANILQGLVVAVFNVKDLYLLELQSPETSPSEQATIYLFDKEGGGVPIYLAKDFVAPQIQNKNAPGNNELQELLRGTAFHYSQPLQSTDGQKNIIFIPTSQYLLQALGVWPWYTLVGGLAITGLIGMMAFQQARRGMVIAQQVEEKTQLLRQITRDLAEKENKLRAVVEHTIDGLVTTDDQGIIESFNPACERIFGYTAQDVMGKNINILFQDYSPIQETPQEGAIAKEITGRRQNGTTFPLDLSISSFRLDDRLFFSGIIRDITERKEAEDELRRYSEEVEQFAYVAAHDLKSPLRGIDNIAQWIADDIGQGITPEIQGHLNMMRNRIRRMEKLLHDVLQYSKAGRVTGELQKVDTKEMVEMIAVNQPRDKTVEVSCVTPMPVFITARTPLEQIFSNLISNAIKHNDMPQGHITVSASDGGEFYEFTVQDNGPGIPPEYQQRVFDLFQTLHHQDKIEGSGLGMSIVKKLVEWQGGQVWIVSNPGERGTAVHFQWPRQMQVDRRQGRILSGQGRF